MTEPEPAWVCHVDLDEFIAAVEVLRRPELAGRPVVVGGTGDPTRRSVVATASYAAREFGVRSGMPMKIAARKLPDAVFLPADNTHYEAVSAQVMAVIRELPGVVLEPIGWDEAFVGVRSADPEAFAQMLQQQVLAATGLWCSVGIGDTTLRAKIATGFGKPRGMFRLTAANWNEVMGDRPPGALWGIGSRTAAKLGELGIHTVAELARSDPGELAARFGPSIGPWLVGVGRGQGRSTVTAEPWVRRSRSRETTYQENLTGWPDIQAGVVELAERLAEDLIADARTVIRVGLKVRFAPFFTVSHAAKLPAPTTDPAVLVAAALRVLEQFDHDRPVRLLGVRFEYDRD